MYDFQPWTGQIGQRYRTENSEMVSRMYEKLHMISSVAWKNDGLFNK